MLTINCTCLRSKKSVIAFTQAVKCNWDQKYRLPFLSNATLVSGSRCVLRVVYLWNRWLLASLIFVWSLASDSTSWGITLGVTRGSSAAMDSASSLTLVLQEKNIWVDISSVHEYTRRSKISPSVSVACNSVLKSMTVEQLSIVSFL